MTKAADKPAETRPEDIPAHRTHDRTYLGPDPEAVKFSGKPKSLDERNEDAGIEVPASRKPKSRENVDIRHSSQAAKDGPESAAPKPESDENVETHKASSDAHHDRLPLANVEPESSEPEPFWRHSSEAAATKDNKPEDVLGDAPGEHLVLKPALTNSEPDVILRELDE